MKRIAIINGVAIDADNVVDYIEFNNFNDSMHKTTKQLKQYTKSLTSKMNEQTCTGRKSDRKRNRANRWR